MFCNRLLKPFGTRACARRGALTAIARYFMNWLKLILIVLPIALLASLKHWFGRKRGKEMCDRDQQLRRFRQFLSASFKDIGIFNTLASPRYRNEKQACNQAGVSQASMDVAVNEARKEYRDRIVKRQNV